MNKLFVILLVTASAAAQTETDSSAVKLDEIIIDNPNKTFTNKNGNLKVDVANSILKSIPDVLDLLSKIPKVQVSPNRESISVIGKGNPLIYIDNARADIETLTSLSVDDIKSIEIVNNPSAKYEADGKAVILITRKASRKDGFQVGISETLSFKKGTNLFNAANFSAKYSKIEVRGNVSYNDLNPWESNANHYTIPGANITSDYLVAGFCDRRQALYGGGIFAKLNEHDYVSITINGKSETDDFRFKTLTNNRENDVFNQIETQGNNVSAKHFINAVGSYNNRSAISKSGFFLGVQYSRLGTPSVIRSSNNYNESQFSPFVKTVQDFEIGSLTARLDFDKEFKNKTKFETGLLHSSVVAKTNVDNTDFEQNTNVATGYTLDERITSGYVQVSGEIKKVSWSAGIRAENTNISGLNSGESAPAVNRDYTNVFPKAQIEIAIDSIHTMTFNYIKSISRPGYSSTNQGVTYINPYFVFTGNINLNPSITDELSLNFQYKDKSIKAGFYRTKDNINYSFVYDDTARLLTHRPENFDSEVGYNLEFTAPLAWRFWTAMNVCSVNVTKIDDTNALQRTVKPFVYYYSSHSFRLGKQWALSATGWGMTKRYQGILENNAFCTFDASVSKTIGNWMLTASANDIFGGMTFSEKFALENVSTSTNYYTDRREFAIAVKYTFGKIKAQFDEKAVDENTGRIK